MSERSSLGRWAAAAAVAVPLVLIGTTVWRRMVGGLHRSGGDDGISRRLPLREYRTGRSRSKARDLLVVFLTSDAGWLGLNRTLPRALRESGYDVVSWNSLRYYSKAREIDEASADLEALVTEYTQRWGYERFALVGYSWGAGVLPFLARRLPEALLARLGAIVYLAYPGFGAFRFRPSAWRLEIGDEAIPARDEVAALPRLPSICIAGESDPIRDCRSIEEFGVERRLFPVGHSLTGIVDELMPSILNTLRAGQESSGQGSCSAGDAGSPKRP